VYVTKTLKKKADNKERSNIPAKTNITNDKDSDSANKEEAAKTESEKEENKERSSLLPKIPGNPIATPALA
jgi:hypothetical protein